jgi:uncharacterized membrane protein
VTERGGPRVERWLEGHAGAAAALLVALGAAARLRAARGPFLTPDEALHLKIAGAPGVLDVYRTSLDNAHPPLFVLLLHFWKAAASSDWALRLLPVLFGSLFLWAAYAWARRLFGENTALLTLAFVALLPSVVLVSSDLRGYALLLCMVAAALAALERGLAEESPGWIAAFAALGVLALLSHYAAFRFAAAALAYSAVRLATGPRSARVVAAWAAAAAVLGAVGAMLARTHVSRLRGGALEAEVRATWLREAYFRRGEDGSAAFLWRQTLSLFHYLFSATATGIIALGLFFFALVLLVRRRQPAVVLLALPLLLSAAGGLLAVYPYGGTRHSIDLVLFISAGVAVALSRLTGERRWMALAAAAALAPAAFFAAG